MIIGIEAQRANSPAKTGVEHYAKQLILHLAETDRLNRYILYLRSEPEEWLKNLPENFQIKVIPFPLFWTQLRISWEMLLHPVDVLLIPASALPLIHPKNSVVTIHDLGWKFYPESFTWFNRNFLEVSTRFAVRRAKKIIAVSESTKKDLVKFYRISPEKISVVYHGYEENIFAGADGGLNLPEKYILFLSTLQPRKNLEGLVRAFRLYCSEFPDSGYKLVVVGRAGWKFKKILELLDANKDIVEYLNYLSDSQRWQALRKAALLVQPAFYEGFGMQILEAFAAGVPVAASNVSSLPEVAQDAAIYFNPKRDKEIEIAIKTVLADQSLRNSLIEKGKKRLEKFSWKKCAEETLAVLKEAFKNE